MVARLADHAHHPLLTEMPVEINLLRPQSLTLREPCCASLRGDRTFLSRLSEAFVLAPSNHHSSAQQSGFMADSRGALRARIEAVAAPAILAALFLLMTAVVLMRSGG